MSPLTYRPVGIPKGILDTLSPDQPDSPEVGLHWILFDALGMPSYSSRHPTWSLGWGINLIWDNSTQAVHGPLTLDLALARYKQGKCPCCGKSRGEIKGLEYRTRSNDLYCHTCKRRWPVEMDLADLQRELQSSLQSVPDSRLSQRFDLPHCKTSGIQTETSGLRRLIRRIVLTWRQ